MFEWSLLRPIVCDPYEFKSFDFFIQETFFGYLQYVTPNLENLFLPLKNIFIEI